ncbi:uncharacterized protein LOC131930663 [Physella acuta]|uniref:uncharacterized protein LOC131930663 n=1 Tax=Physella acuta TaxID=109671 RepID=UPI0027DBA992|nr:uncharacterized protein LOC131930663 [Physella acuta]
MTHCEEGLIVGKDFAIFKAEVDLGNSSQVAGKTVKVEATIDGGSTFQHLCLVNLEERCSMYAKGHCFCQREEESKVYHIIINISATHRYSNSLIRGHLKHAQGSGYDVNTVRRFPRMYNITNVTFLVNRTHLLGETTLIYDNNIRFCCPDSPRPCTAILVSGQQTISSNEGCVSADVSSLNVLENVSFIYDFCKGEKVRKIITVRKQQTGLIYLFFIAF